MSAAQLMRPDSQLSYSSASKAMYGNNNEERHYQNIQLYQLNPAGQRTASPGPGALASPSQTGQQLGPNNPGKMLHGSVSSLQPSLGGPEPSPSNMGPSMRPVSALITTRDQQEQQQRMMSHSISASGPDFFKYDPQQQRRKDVQEAKMEEIREGVRRQQQQGQASYLATMPRGVSMSSTTIGNPNGTLGKPYATQAHFRSQQALNGQQSTLMRQAKQAPPPAPKPVRPTTSGSALPQQQSVRFAGPTSAQKDERKRSREDEIQYLESLAYRDPATEERLKSLILEREFQRRAEEHDDEEEEQEDEDLDRADRQEMIANIQQNLEETRIRRLQEQQSSGNNVIQLSKTLQEQEEKLKQLHLDEQRLIQEAKKRQVSQLASETLLHFTNLLFLESQQSMEEISKAVPVGKGILKMSSNYNSNGDSEVPPPLPNSSPPIESANQRLDRLISMKNGNGTDENGSKSVKKVSWNDNPAMQVLEHDDEHPEEAEEEEEEVEYEDEREQEEGFSLQDIDDVLGPQANTNKDWFQVSSNTPGVIGAQEIYNDPRKRIEAERIAKSNLNSADTDKELSFKEKMALFKKGPANGDVANNGGLR